MAGEARLGLKQRGMYAVVENDCGLNGRGGPLGLEMGHCTENGALGAWGAEPEASSIASNKRHWYVGAENDGGQLRRCIAGGREASSLESARRADSVGEVGHSWPMAH